MRPYCIDLTDRALALARGGQLLSSAPSVVFDGSTPEIQGAAAFGALRLHPTAASTRHLLAVLTEAASQGRPIELLSSELKLRLSAFPPRSDERIWIASPAVAEARGLGAFLGVARDLGLTVDGFVDAATASVAALALDGPAIVLELGLHHVAATAVERAGNQVSRRRTVASDGGGWLEAHQSWLELVSRTMVKQTRFDPLHDASTEQQVFDSLRRLSLDATTHGQAKACLNQGAERFEVTLSRDQLGEATSGLRREVMRLLHALRPAGTAICLVAPGTLIELPGLKEDLESLAGCELISLADGFAAAAVSLLELPERPAGEPVRLLRRLPVRSAVLGDLATREPLGHTRLSPPSHVLLAGQAYALAGEPLVVGRDPGQLPGVATRALSLAQGLAGVSRRHCTFLASGSEIVLLDHSRFGTFVNGERVMERVRVHAGDRVRLGEPGIELALIAVGEGVGASS
jgi:hypothetical protein